MREKSYLKALVICHGKSEVQICEHIKQKLRLRIDILSNNKGKSSIQITSVMKFLNNTQLKNLTSLKNNYAVKVENKKLDEEFKVFIIMDTDDCSQEQKLSYIDKSMFKNHVLYGHIVPIYNTPELETVLTNSGITFTKKGVDRKSEYIRIFPTDKKYEKNDVVQLEEFHDNLKKCKTTNFNEFIKFCLDL